MTETKTRPSGQPTAHESRQWTRVCVTRLQVSTAKLIDAFWTLQNSHWHLLVNYFLSMYSEDSLVCSRGGTCLFINVGVKRLGCHQGEDAAGASSSYIIGGGHVFVSMLLVMN